MTGRLISITPTREFEAVYTAEHGDYRERLDAIGIVEAWSDGIAKCKIVGLTLACGGWSIADEAEGYSGMVRVGEPMDPNLEGDGE